MLTREQYNAIAGAEKVIYGTDPGSHGYTDIMAFEDIPSDDPVHDLWAIAQMALENTWITQDEVPHVWLTIQTGKRVAQAFAILNFGPEILLK